MIRVSTAGCKKGMVYLIDQAAYKKLELSSLRPSVLPSALY